LHHAIENLIKTLLLVGLGHRKILIHPLLHALVPIASVGVEK